MRGASPRSANSTRKIRLGITTAMYWSPARMFRPIAVAATVRISFVAERARATTGRMRRSRKPACSMTAAKLSAPRMSQTVVSMLDMPPRENKLSMASFPLVETKPVAIAA